MSAKTAKWLRESLVDRTLQDHEKCDPEAEEPCIHVRSWNLPVALHFEAGIKINKKRATLDIQCPYSTENAQGQILLFKYMADRIKAFAHAQGVHKQQREAAMRVRDEILAYANRNAMQVIAEAAR